MPSSIPHQKFCFYHLPTRGRTGIKLGDAWYVSNVSIIFDRSMLYYLLFWILLGFILHIYNIFGTNLLTGGPARIAVFLPISVFEEKEYQMESKRNETFGRVVFGSRLFQKSCSRRFHSVWYSFSAKHWNRQKIAICTRPWVSRLVPKII